MRNKPHIKVQSSRELSGKHPGERWSLFPFPEASGATIRSYCVNSNGTSPLATASPRKLPPGGKESPSSHLLAVLLVLLWWGWHLWPRLSALLSSLRRQSRTALTRIRSPSVFVCASVNFSSPGLSKKRCSTEPGWVMSQVAYTYWKEAKPSTMIIRIDFKTPGHKCRPTHHGSASLSWSYAVSRVFVTNSQGPPVPRHFLYQDAYERLYPDTNNRSITFGLGVRQLIHGWFVRLGVRYSLTGVFDSNCFVQP